MNAKICDRCGKTFVPNNTELNQYRCRVADTEAHLRYFDMCPDCLHALDKFMEKPRTPGFDYNPKPKKYRGRKFRKSRHDYNLYNSHTESTEANEEEGRDLSLKPRYYKPYVGANLDNGDDFTGNEEDPE